jgi:regulator of replication initiation timing
MDADEPAPERGTAMDERRPPLLSLLAEAGVASEGELQLALVEGMGTGERLGEVVLRRGLIDEAGLARLLARQRNLPFLEGEVEVDRDASVLLPAEVGCELGACAVVSLDGLFVVAVAEPTEERFDAVRAATGAEPSFAVVAPATLERLLERVAAAEEETRTAEQRSGAARAAEADRAEATLGWLERELGAATAQLGTLHERVREFVGEEHRTELELDACRRQVAALTEARAAAEGRVRVLEGELAQHRERAAAVRTMLAEAGETLDG